MGPTAVSWMRLGGFSIEGMKDESMLQWQVSEGNLQTLAVWVKQELIPMTLAKAMSVIHLFEWLGRDTHRIATL